MAIRARYKGDGSQFHAGIPARNLEEAEYQALDPEQRKMVRESPLYDTKTDAEMHNPPAPSGPTAISSSPSSAKDGPS